MQSKILNRPRVKWFLALAYVVCSAIMLAQQPTPSSQTEAATLDKMKAAGKSQHDLAQYVFDTHGCKSCHVAGQDGKEGLTAKGHEIGKGFEGCVSMLSAMNLIAQVEKGQRTPDQRKKADRFEEFGCTFCHRITPGKMGLTDVGTKLSQMHLGCVEVEQQVAVKH